MTSGKANWKATAALHLGKGAGFQQFTATVGDLTLEIDVTRWGEGHLRANGFEIAHTDNAKDARQAFRELRRMAEGFLQKQIATPRDQLSRK
jgi:hypothetical protein